MSEGANSKAWQKFLTELGHEVSFAEIQYADESTRAELLHSMTTLSTIERAQISSTWTKMGRRVHPANSPGGSEGSDAINVLSKHLVDQAARSDQPLKTTWARIRKALATYDQMSPASLKQVFADRAKLGTMSTTESIICNMNLYCDPDTRHKITAAILNTTSGDLVSFINVALAEEQADPTFIDHNGARILKMPGPLFPVDPAFSSLNHQAICGTEVTGGGHDAKGKTMPDRPLFRTATRSGATTRSAELQGGGTFRSGRSAMRCSRMSPRLSSVSSPDLKPSKAPSRHWRDQRTDR